MATDTPKNKFDKKCPACGLYINSKGYENHVRAHQATTQAAHNMAFSAEEILREEAREMLKTEAGKEIMREEARKILEGMMKRESSTEGDSRAA